MTERCAACGGPIGGPKRSETGDGWQMHLGDCLRLLPRLADESFDAVITDPPYGSGGMTAAERLRPTKEKYVTSGAAYASALPDIAGDAVFPEQWAADMSQFFHQARRLLKPGGVFLAFIDWRNLYAYHKFALAAGLKPKGLVVWDKGRGSRPNRGGFRRQSEFVYWAVRAGSVRSDVYLDGVLRHSVLVNGKQHILQKPLGLMRELMQVVPAGGSVLDPFAGSGTTGVAALLEGRTFVGYEVVPHYFETACQRLREVQGG